MSVEHATPLGVAILSLLEERDMHPYEMIQTLRLRKEDQWIKLRTGSLYHQVERLAEQGLAQAIGTQQEGNRPARTTYRLTAAGRQALTDWITRQLTEVENPYFSFSLALGEISTLEPAVAVDLLTERCAVLRRALIDLDETLQLAQEHDAHRIWMLAHEHRRTQLAAELDFITTLVTDIDSKDLTWPNHP